MSGRPLVRREADATTITLEGVFTKGTEDGLTRPYFSCPYIAQDVDFHIPRDVLDSDDYRERIGSVILGETQLRQAGRCRCHDVRVLWYHVHTDDVTECYTIEGDYLGSAQGRITRCIPIKQPVGAFPVTRETLAEFDIEIDAARSEQELGDESK